MFPKDDDGDGDSMSSLVLSVTQIHIPLEPCDYEGRQLHPDNNNLPDNIRYCHVLCQTSITVHYPLLSVCRHTTAFLLGVLMLDDTLCAPPDRGDEEFTQPICLSVT